MSDASCVCVDTDALNRHPDLWFDDGNVVLRVEDTIYKFLRSILSRESPLFADMFSLPQAADIDSSDTYHGCPLVRFSETAKDMSCFLAALSDPK